MEKKLIIGFFESSDEEANKKVFDLLSGIQNSNIVRSVEPSLEVIDIPFIVVDGKAYEGFEAIKTFIEKLPEGY